MGHLAPISSIYLHLLLHTHIHTAPLLPHRDTFYGSIHQSNFYTSCSCSILKVFPKHRKICNNFNVLRGSKSTKKKKNTILLLTSLEVKTGFFQTSFLPSVATIGCRSRSNLLAKDLFAVWKGRDPAACTRAERVHARYAHAHACILKVNSRVRRKTAYASRTGRRVTRIALD